MSFDIYYKIKDYKLEYVGMAGVKGAKKVSFESYESSIFFEDRLLRLMHNNTMVDNKKIKELYKEVNG